MGENSSIEWTDHTGGPWLGCTEVSPGCGHCYSRELTKARLAPIFRKAYKAAGFADWKTRAVWGDAVPRVKTIGFWEQALRFNKKAEKDGKRPKMFPSLIDWLDDMPSGIIDQDGNWLSREEVLADFLRLIHGTPHLTWLLLTKRPQNWSQRIAQATDAVISGGGAILGEQWLRGEPPSNVWIGASIEDQDRLKRHSDLMEIPAGVHFWSVEPMLSEIDCDRAWSSHGAPDWVICGGESGPKHRPMQIEWAESLREQCRVADVRFFMKQDSGPMSGMKGRLSDELYHTKELPLCLPQTQPQ